MGIAVNIITLVDHVARYIGGGSAKYTAICSRYEPRLRVCWNLLVVIDWACFLDFVIIDVFEDQSSLGRGKMKYDFC
jgi:hypothetical protein